MSKKKSQRKEIIYNLVNAGLAGGLVLLGSLTGGEITGEGIFFAVVAALIVVLTKFKEFWDGEKGEYTSRIFNFTPNI